MTSYSRQAVIAGACITLLVLLAQALGWLDGLERQSIDFRSRHAWWRPRPMSPQICHVDIDDGALVTIGRWPWDRARLTDALNELRSAGAKVIAFDLILAESQKPRPLTVPRNELPLRAAGLLSVNCPDDPAQPCQIVIDEDVALAAAMRPPGPPGARGPDAPGVPGTSGAGRCVLSVKASEGLAIHEEWQSQRGRGEWSQLIDALSRDLRAPPEQIIERAGLTGWRQSLFVRRINQFKQIAAWHALQQLQAQAQQTGTALTFEALVAATVPGLSDLAGEIPELSILRTVWDQHRSWQALRPLLLAGPSSANPSEDQAPIWVLAREASAVGFVNRQEDRDGAIRAIRPLWPVPGGLAVQLGVMAAAAYQGLTPQDIRVTDDRLFIGPTALPLRDGRLWLAWPRPLERGAGAFGVLRQDEAGSEAAGHLSIGALVQLAQQRRLQQQVEQQYAIRTFEMAHSDQTATADFSMAQMTPQMIAAARNYIDLNSVVLETSPDQLSPEEVEIARLIRTWTALDESVQAGRDNLAVAEKEVRDRVRDKLCFIGATFTGVAADFVPTPLDPLTPGVVVHAVVADMVLSGRYLRFAPAWSTYALIVCLGIASTLAAASLTPVRSTLLALAIFLGYLALAGFLVFSQMNLVVAMVGPCLAGVGAWVGCTVVEAALYQRDRLRITRQFKARVSSQLVDYLVANPEAATMAGEQREMTIMFTDLAGFTGISEKLGGPATVATLNRYMSAMTKQLIDDGAYLNKFLGDGFMAFWSAFALNPQQATHACRAALHCIDTVERLNAEPQYAGLPRLALRVGIATGRVIVGDCGAPPQLNDYTVIGDAVNLASRLESANKQFGTRVLIDGRTRELLDDPALRLRPIGRIVAVGQTTPIEVFEVLASDHSADLIDLTARAVEAFRAGDLQASAAAWRALLERCGPSKLADLYLSAIDAAQRDPDFDGVLRLQLK